MQVAAAVALITLVAQAEQAAAAKDLGLLVVRLSRAQQIQAAAAAQVMQR